MKIKTLLARVYLSRAASKTHSSSLSLPLDFTDKALLVLLPSEQRELTVVKQVLPDITTIFGTRNVHLLAFPGTQVESIFPSKGFRIISPGRSVVGWSGLPTRAFLERMRAYKFDYIFETNLSENLFAARILLEFPEAVRFGNMGHLGLPYLNLEIKTRYLRDRRQIYRSILEVVGNLANNIRHMESIPRSDSVPEET